MALPTPIATMPPGLDGTVAPLDLLTAERIHATQPLSPPRKVRTLLAGPYRSPFRGRGMEFDEVRTYQPGDDVRAIDWRVTARTGKPHTKLFHEERERPVLLVVDQRPPMRFASRVAFKSVLAARAAAMIAWTAHEAGDRVGAFVVSSSGHRDLPPKRNRRGVLHVLAALSAGSADAGEDPGLPMTEILARTRRVALPGSLVFVLTDGHDFNETAQRHLSMIARHCDVMLLLIHDPLEAMAPRPGHYRMSDGDGVLDIDAGDREWRRAFAARFDQRTGEIARFCRQRRIAFQKLSTDDDLVEMLRRTGR